MALPLILGCAVGAAVIHELKKSDYKAVEEKRRKDVLNRSSSSAKLKKAPSDQYSSNKTAAPLPGSIVCCEVYGMLDHTGIWLDEDTIIELSNSGLVKAVSAQRFLSERSGKFIFVACDRKHQPIVLPQVQERALAQIFTYREYDVIENNCHRFVNFCLTGKDTKLTRFQSLNESIAELSKQNIYWDKVKLQQI